MSETCPDLEAREWIWKPDNKSEELDEKERMVVIVVASKEKPARSICKTNFMPRITQLKLEIMVFHETVSRVGAIWNNSKATEEE